MSKIIVKTARIIKKVNLGRDNFIFDIAPFPETGSIKPGQFVHIGIPHSDVFFRRAFSVYDIDADQNSFSIVFKIFGHGTALMAQLDRGDQLDILGPLGNGFGLPSKRETVILAAGGIGIPPIYLLAKKLVVRGYDKEKLVFCYGATSQNDLIDIKRIKKLGTKLVAATDDGSYGFSGFVTEAIKELITDYHARYRIYACGPEGMLKEIGVLSSKYGIPGQVSLEAPMPCGIGICLGCVRPRAAGGYTRVCREGPVYNIGEVLL